MGADTEVNLTNDTRATFSLSHLLSSCANREL